jgi:catechol 2,3-dioxygenase-like lactoylglutathione lyase family enzyme
MPHCPQEGVDRGRLRAGGAKNVRADADDPARVRDPTIEPLLSHTATVTDEWSYGQAVNIEQTALIVEDYDEAIRFFVDALGFELVEDSPATTNDGRPKRWVVVKPPGGQTGLLLAQADGEHQVQALGTQYAGRVGLFLRVDDFEASHRRMVDHGVSFVTEPRDETYGRVAVFLDIAGNRWDLLGPLSK